MAWAAVERVIRKESEAVRKAAMRSEAEYGAVRILAEGVDIRLALYFPLHAAWREWSSENPDAG